MNNQITYADKVALNQNSSIPDINKVNASDMNEIKSVVNGTINGSIPMGNVVVDSIKTKNLFGNYITLFGYLEQNVMNLHSVGNNRIACIRCKPNTTYTITRSILTTNFKVGAYSGDTLPIPTATATNYNIQTAIANNNGTKITYTTDTNAKWLLIHFGHISSDSSTIWQSVKTIQVEEGSTETTFSSYQDLSQTPNENFWIRNTTYVTATGYMSGYLVGKLFVMSVNFQVADNTPNNTALLTGLPRCKAERFMCVGALNNGNALRLYVNKNGELCNDGIVYLAGASGWLNALLVYPIDE